MTMDPDLNTETLHRAREMGEGRPKMRDAIDAIRMEWERG